MSQEIQDSTLELEEMDLPYHGMQGIIFMADDKDEYLKWYSEDQTALGFQLNKGIFKGVFVYILRDTISIDFNNVYYKHEVIRNPNNIDPKEFESDEFYELLNKAMNDVVTEFFEWKKQNDAELLGAN